MSRDGFPGRNQPNTQSNPSSLQSAEFPSLAEAQARPERRRRSNDNPARRSDNRVRPGMSFRDVSTGGSPASSTETTPRGGPRETSNASSSQTTPRGSPRDNSTRGPSHTPRPSTSGSTERSRQTNSQTNRARQPQPPQQAVPQGGMEANQSSGSSPQVTPPPDLNNPRETPIIPRLPLQPTIPSGPSTAGSAQQPIPETRRPGKGPLIEEPERSGHEIFPRGSASSSQPQSSTQSTPTATPRTSRHLEGIRLCSVGNCDVDTCLGWA